MCSPILYGGLEPMATVGPLSSRRILSQQALPDLTRQVSAYTCSLPPLPVVYTGRLVTTDESPVQYSTPLSVWPVLNVLCIYIVIPTYVNTPPKHSDALMWPNSCKQFYYVLAKRTFCLLFF